MNTFKTSNGPLVIGSNVTIRGIVVTLGELFPLERPELGYTHALSYDGLDGDGGIVGSTLVLPSDVPTIRALILGQPDPTWAGNEIDPAPHGGSLALCL